MKIFAFGHLGDGNVHLNLVGDKKINESKNKIYEVTKYTLDLPAQNMALVREKNTFGQLFLIILTNMNCLKPLKNL